MSRSCSSVRCWKLRARTNAAAVRGLLSLTPPGLRSAGGVEKDVALEVVHVVHRLRALRPGERVPMASCRMTSARWTSLDGHR